MNKYFIRQCRSAHISTVFALLLIIITNPALANSLAAGTAAHSRERLNIPVNPPEFLNWKSRQQILNMRAAQVQKFSNLLLKAYTPNMSIFGRIEDGKPWWGLGGSAVFGAGKKSIIGAAEESRYIMNPFMLVGVNPPCNGIWLANRVSEKDLEDRNFPFFWLPSRIMMDAANAREQILYDIHDYARKTLATGKSTGSQPHQFSLVAYNARDLGYNWIWLDTDKSSNVSNDNPTDSPVAISQMIHCGGSCGYPGGCNNMSPFIANIDRCRFVSLPARAVVCLWKERPSSVTQAPDFTVFIDFK